MDTFAEALRVWVILLAPITFFAAIWYKQSSAGTAKIGLLFLGMGVIGELLQTPKWNGLLSFLTFERGTIHYDSPVIALSYGLLAYAVFRTALPRREEQ